MSLTLLRGNVLVFYSLGSRIWMQERAETHTITHFMLLLYQICSINIFIAMNTEMRKVTAAHKHFQQTNPLKFFRLLLLICDLRDLNDEKECEKRHKSNREDVWKKQIKNSSRESIIFMINEDRLALKLILKLLFSVSSELTRCELIKHSWNREKVTRLHFKNGTSLNDGVWRNKARNRLRLWANI